MPVITPGATVVGAVQLSGLAPNATPIESWLNGLLQGKGFATIAAPGAVAATEAWFELRNPAGSGKNLWVYSILSGKPTAGYLLLNFTTPPSGAGTILGLNLLSGATGGVARGSSGNSATAPGVNFAQLTVQANLSAALPYPWAIVLAPNCGLLVANFTANESFNVNMMWLEV